MRMATKVKEVSTLKRAKTQDSYMITHDYSYSTLGIRHMAHFQIENSELAAPIDRRLASRYAMQIPVELILDSGDRMRILTCDVSASGIFIRVDKTLQVGDYLRFFIMFPGEITTSSKLLGLCDGEVVRRQSEPDENWEGLAIKIQKYQFLSSSD